MGAPEQGIIYLLPFTGTFYFVALDYYIEEICRCRKLGRK
jgi:hypothetical protein